MIFFFPNREYFKKKESYSENEEVNKKKIPQDIFRLESIRLYRRLGSKSDVDDRLSHKIRVSRSPCYNTTGRTHTVHQVYIHSTNLHLYYLRCLQRRESFFYLRKKRAGESFGPT